MRLVFLAFLISFSAFSKTQESIQAIPTNDKYQRPAPRDDTRMGADAAESGTDITDQDVQAQEDKNKEMKWELEFKDLPIDEDNDLESVQK